MPVLTSFIQQVGFPVFVAVVLLLRVDSMHRENLLAISELTRAVEKLLDRLDALSKRN